MYSLGGDRASFDQFNMLNICTVLKMTKYTETLFSCRDAVGFGTDVDQLFSIESMYRDFFIMVRKTLPP